MKHVRYAFLDFLSLSVCIHNMQLCLASLSLALVIVNLCPQMEGHQNVSSSTGPPELNHSYYAGNSLSALHSSQQVHEDSVSTSVHSRSSTQRLIDNTPSCSALGSQLLHGNTGSPVLAGPLAMSQVKQCQPRSLRPSRSSHSWSLFSAATS